MTRRKRSVTEDERAQFEAAIAGNKPDTPKERHQTSLGRPPVPMSARRRPTGIDGKTAERLRKGAIEPDARIDMHGLTEMAAHQALTVFLKDAIANGARLVLIITGKGKMPRAPDEPFDLELDRRTRGVLKAMVPRWLREPAMVRFVAYIGTAHRRHGGIGALYVYLRKERKSS